MQLSSGTGCVDLQHMAEDLFPMVRVEVSGRSVGGREGERIGGGQGREEKESQTGGDMQARRSESKGKNVSLSTDFPSGISFCFSFCLSSWFARKIRKAEMMAVKAVNRVRVGNSGQEMPGVTPTGHTSSRNPRSCPSTPRPPPAPPQTAPGAD